MCEEHHHHHHHHEHNHGVAENTDLVKLRILLPHWMDHNEEHAAGFDEWAGKAAASGHEDAAQMIRRAAESMRQANQSLQLALDTLGEAAIDP